VRREWLYGRVQKGSPGIEHGSFMQRNTAAAHKNHSEIVGLLWVKVLFSQELMVLCFLLDFVFQNI